MAFSLSFHSKVTFSYLKRRKHTYQTNSLSNVINYTVEITRLSSIMTASLYGKDEKQGLDEVSHFSPFSKNIFSFEQRIYFFPIGYFELIWSNAQT